MAAHEFTPQTRSYANKDWTSSLHTFSDGLEMIVWNSEQSGKFLCNNCPKEYQTVHSLVRHWRAKHSNSIAPEPEGPGPVRLARRRSVQLNPTRSHSGSRSASAQHTPTVPSPLSRQAVLDSDDEERDDEAHQMDMDTAQDHVGVDQAMGGLTIASPAIAVQPLGGPEEGAAYWSLLHLDSLTHAGLAILLPLKVIICLFCRRCFAWDRAHKHLVELHKIPSVTPSVLKGLSTQHTLCNADSVKDLVALVRASGRYYQCSWLEQLPGWWCEECGWASESEEMAQKHRRSPGHAWSKYLSTINGGRRMVPKDVVSGRVQTLFHSNQGGVIPSIPVQTIAPAQTSAGEILLTRLEMRKDLFKPQIVPHDDPRKTHPFLKISGFGRWIGKMSVKEVQALQELTSLKSASWGPVVLQHCLQMIDRCFDLCLPENYVACCQINSPTVVIVTMPFGEVTADTKKRYATSWAGFITMVLNGRDAPPNQRRFTLSKLQRDQITCYLKYLQHPSPQTADTANMGAEALVLLSSVLLRQELGGKDGAEHPLITYTILSSIKPGNIVSDPVHISPFLAGLEYCARATIMVIADLASCDPTATVTFHHAVLSLVEWIREGHNTPFAWIRQMLHLTAVFARSTNRIGRFVWGLDEGEPVYSFDGYRIWVSEFKCMVRSSVVEAVEGFFQLWTAYGLFGEVDPPHVTDTIGDALSQRAANYNFLRHPLNVDLQNAEIECIATMANSDLFCTVIDGQVIPYVSRVHEALERSRQFLLSLAAAIYLSSGQPPRGSELMNTLLVNIDTRVRNVFFVNGRFVICGFLNKTSFLLKSDKAIPRELCKSLSSALLGYVLIRTLEIQLASLIHVDEEVLLNMRQNLFYTYTGPLDTSSLTGRLKRLWETYIPRTPQEYKGWGTAETRQNLIYIGSKCIKATALGSDAQAILDLQAGHTSSVARSWYGVEDNRLGGDLDGDTLVLFCRMSREHHKFFDLETIQFQMNQPTSNALAQLPHQRASPLERDTRKSTHPASMVISSAADDDHIEYASSEDEYEESSPTGTPIPLPSLNPDALSRRLAPLLVDKIVQAMSTQATPTSSPSLLSQPNPFSSHLQDDDDNSTLSLAHARPPIVTPAIFRAMRQLVPGGRFRSIEQAAAVQKVWERSEHLLVVLPTGGGKTLIAQTAAQLDRAEGGLNIIFVPLKALAAEVIDRCNQMDLIAQEWDETGTADSQVVVTICETVCKSSFLAWLRDMVASRPNVRAIIDEAHYPAFAGDFRENMQGLSILLSFKIPIVLLSATVPVSRTQEVVQFYGLQNPRVIRASTNRPNIRYIINRLPNERSSFGDMLDDIEAAIRMYKPKDDRRVIVYVLTVGLANKIHQAHCDRQGDDASWVKYHSQMKHHEKAESLNMWTTVIVATAAFGLGVDPKDTSLVITYEGPRSMLEYVQQSGRAGRDGRECASVLLWSTLDQTNKKDKVDRAMLETLLIGSTCRRQMVAGYMDGGGPNCLAMDKDNVLCDICQCETETQRAVLTLPPPAPKPGPKIIRASNEASAPALLYTYDAILEYVNTLQGKCMRCYLKGITEQPHKRRAWHCDNGELNKERFTSFLTWRKGNIQIKGMGTFPEILCRYCLMPRDREEFHDQDVKRLLQDRCRFPDTLIALAWLAFDNVALMTDYLEEHPSKKFEDRGVFGAWLSAGTNEGTMRVPNLYPFCVWVDRWISKYAVGRAIVDASDD